MDNQVSFFLNGKKVTLDAPSPDMLLIDYLKSPDVNLTGPKKPCGQGGCGGCTVILSDWDEKIHKPRHRAINSCLRPVTALNGLVVTTVEGTGTPNQPLPARIEHNLVMGRAGAPRMGSQDRVAPDPLKSVNAAKAVHQEVVAKAETAAQVVKDGANADLSQLPLHGGMNPVAHRLAANNGTQCGYCSVGFVMNMTEFLFNNHNATKREIEQALDGNLCRCTGYRAILTGMKTFAGDWSEEDEKERMKCRLDHEARTQIPASKITIPFPEAAEAAPTPAAQTDGARKWLAPTSMAELVELMNALPEARLVHANTSYGIYADEYQAADVLIDVRAVPELQGELCQEHGYYNIPAGTDYSTLLTKLEKEMLALGLTTTDPDGRIIYPSTSPLGALHHMAMRTAGRLVRNAATIGGNFMLVAHHVAEGEPFPSDAATALTGTESWVEWVDVRCGPEPKWSKIDDLFDELSRDASIAKHMVLTRFQVLLAQEKGVLTLAQKVALREVNSHSLVNTTSQITLDDDGLIRHVNLTFGGVAPYPWRARQTEQLMLGKPFNLDAIGEIAESLLKEVLAEFDAQNERMAGLPYEGVSNAYKAQLATSFLYKAYVNGLEQTGGLVPAPDQSAGVESWGNWEVSHGHQSWESDAPMERQPVGVPYIKYLGMEQTAGKLRYTHELPSPYGTLFASLVHSSVALGVFHFKHPESGAKLTVKEMSEFLAERFAAFEELITCKNVPKTGINPQGMGADQPLLSDGTVVYVGQCLALVAATSPMASEEIAQFVQAKCVGYTAKVYEAPDGGEKPAWWDQPVLTLEDAISVGSVYPDWPSQASFVSHIWKITRPGSVMGWSDWDADPITRPTRDDQISIDGVSCTVSGSTHKIGGQVHFYMEPQAVLVEPGDAHTMTVYPSTQSPQEMHQTSAMAIGAQYNHLQVNVPPVGGGFGGKTEQTRFVVGPAVVAASATDKPVRLALSRDEDTSMIGKRHGYFGKVQIALDNGDIDPADRGRIRGQNIELWGDGGAFYDCSFIVSNCIITRADNAYSVPNYQAQIDVCRTNTAPSTAMRAFGDIQSKAIVEAAIDDAAYALSLKGDAITGEEVREKSLYVRGQATPFGQALTYCYMQEVWEWLKDKADLAARQQEVAEFNAKNRWRKRGVAMLPVKYGSGYNLPLLEQATASLAIYQSDGTVVIHQSGVEMGQGLLTVARQVAAMVLNIPMDMVRVENAHTAVTPNPTSTGGSTGTSYNAEAVKQLCQEMRKRLMAYADYLRDQNGEQWCVNLGVDYWNYKHEGWQAISTVTGKQIWPTLITQAYGDRVNLTATHNAQIEGGLDDMPNITYKSSNPKDQPSIPGYTVSDTPIPGAFTEFCGWTYSAACAVVEVDVLTGETKVLSADLAYDMGMSLNPAVDIGQVEGAFVQGVGLMLTEKMAFQPKGADDEGRLNTVNTWRYKIPATTTIPLRLDTHLFPRSKVPFELSPTEGVLSSKEVGEPPLVLATSVFLAVRNAVRASRVERGLDPFFVLDAPATVDAVSTALEVTPEQFSTS
ncbi:molybdopterin cofactor-binding domain-containing protein [Shimia sp. Alg240-R146]|uniref:molybdopterin cofactor-binding domain-containing protein n=1 Tax=Shimia sp. Alg240-R146 TaxID=2993449 RepID=UPI0022E27DAC|nr:molybdopterin cofactor-binding domain-containing protein [Shimia sp. Alg240-R146]